MPPRVGRAARSAVTVWLISAANIVWTFAATADPLPQQVTSAQAGHDMRTNWPLVTFALTQASKEAFHDFTSRHVGRAVEFRVDGRTAVKTIVREPILGGSGQIIVSSEDEAKALASSLSAGTAKLEVEAAAE